MSTASRLTISEKLLRAAARRWSSAGEAFSAEDLIVAAWQDSPETFGLQGYVDEYPDSNRVLTNIMGGKGLRQKGWITALGRKRYSLTNEGLRHAQSQVEGVPEGLLRGQLGREESRRLVKLYTGSAYRKFLEGQTDRLLFRDACVFWGITPRSVSEELRNQFAAIDSLIEGVLAATQNGKSLSFGAGDANKLEQSDARSMADLHQLLLTRFEQDLTPIRNRTKSYGKSKRRVVD
jgi:hypothetical protein